MTDAVLPGQQIIDAIQSQIAELGVFETINAHDPNNPPGNGLTAAIWVQEVTSQPAASGLDEVSVLFVVNLRAYMPITSEPYDYVDPAMTKAVDQCMGSIAGGFTLGGLVRNVDLLGESGVRFSAQYGYVGMGGSRYRAVTITIPSIINDVWEEDE